MKTKKIAIIDDEPDIVFYLASALQDNGFEVCTATNAHEGLELIRSQRPDLVCLDILMPEQTGFSLYRKIKEDKSLKGVRILIISALSMEQEMARIGSALKPDGYIEKPVDISLFITTVQRLAA
ncbi:response regulator [Candidatus Poribacteria bacterium]|nr:response regulator [Candidatus Poribacteria bacterium]